MFTSFELTIDDTSPLVNYYPFAETLGTTNLSAGWNSYFSQSGFLKTQGQVGLGDSLHVTSLDGASFTIKWFGTGISVFGSLADATYQVSLDGFPPSIGLLRQDVLAEFQGLEPKQHSLALVAHPNGVTSNASSYLAFDRAAVNVSTELIGAAISSEVVDIISPRWTFSGNWSKPFHRGLLLSPPDQFTRVSKTRGNTATINFTGSAVALLGVRNITHGHYNVTLDGTTTMFDGRSGWLENSTLFLQSGLNETAQHTLTVTNADEASFGITSLNVTHVSGGTLAAHNSGSQFSVGTIIGVVLATAAGVLAIVTVIFYTYFRRRRTRHEKPSFLNDGISTSSIVRDIDARWSPVRSHRAHLRNKSDHAWQDLYNAASHGVGGTDPTENDQHNETVDSSVMQVSHTPQENIVTPVPYLPASKAPAASAARRDKGQTPNSKMEKKRGMESIFPGLSTVPTHALSGTTSPQQLYGAAKPLNLHSRKGSTSTGTSLPQRLRVDIPQSRFTSKPTTVTPVTQRRALLLSPLRHRATPRSAKTLSQEMGLPLVGTAKPARPLDEFRARRSITGERTTLLAEEGSLSSPPRKDPFST